MPVQRHHLGTGVTPSKREVMMDPLLSKGHMHRPTSAYVPALCPSCKGVGVVQVKYGGDSVVDCEDCQGEGVLYEG